MAEDEKKELTEEERAEMAAKWETYVRDELNALLDIYLPNTVAGNVGIKYAHPIISSYEDGTKNVDEKKAVGVNIHINFRFADVVEIPEEMEIPKEDT